MTTLSLEIAPAPKAQTVEAYGQQIYQECIEGSGIAPSLFHICIKIHQDIEVGAGGDISTPIHEALGWHYTRFGQKANESLFAAFFTQETGEEWQAKLSKPRTKDGKELKYETPIGSGSRAYLPPLPLEIRQAIAERYGCEVPPPGESFWDWLELHPEIKIILTEGGKKGLCLLSHGYVAIALTGVNGGYRTTKNGVPLPTPELIPDLARFAIPGRRFLFAFDQDIKPTARGRVAGAIGKNAKLLAERGCEVEIARWSSDDGKGVDDLIVNGGLVAWQKAYSEAKSLTHWYIYERETNRLRGYKPTFGVHVPDLSTAIDPASIPHEGIVALPSDQGTGKSKFTVKTVKPKVVKPGPRISLERNAAKLLGGHFINDVDYAQDRPLNPIEGRFLSAAEASRKTLCFDSLLRISIENVAGGDLILDEADQGMRHLLTSATCSKGGKRSLLLNHFERLVKAAKRVLVLSGTLSHRELDYLSRLRNEPIWLLQNTYKRPRGDCRFIHAADDSAIMAEILEKVRAGKRLFVLVDKLSKALVLHRLLKPIIGEEAIFELNSQTSGGDRGQEFAAMPDRLLADNPQIQVAIITPSGFTGLSIESDRFDEVMGLYYGQSVVTDDILQSLERVRSPIPRAVWAVKHGRAYSNIGQSTHPSELKRLLKKRTDTTAKLLRGELSPEIADTLDRYGWEDNPHLDAWAEYEADRNFSMLYFRDCLQVRLEMSGYKLDIVRAEADKATKASIGKALEDIKIDAAIEIAAATNLSEAEAKALERKTHLEPDDAIALAKWQLANWYAIPVESVEADDVLFDRNGRTRAELYRLENILFPELAKAYDTRTIERSTPSGAPVTAWDFSYSEQERKVYELLGFFPFLEFGLKAGEWNKNSEMALEIAGNCRQYAAEIKAILKVTITDRMTDMQIIGEMLRRIGLRTKSRRHRIAGERIRTYALDFGHLDSVSKILSLRHQKRLQSGFQCVPSLLANILFNAGGTASERTKNIDPPIAETINERRETHSPPQFQKDGP